MKPLKALRKPHDPHDLQNKKELLQGSHFARRGGGVALLITAAFRDLQQVARMRVTMEETDVQKLCQEDFLPR